jgi:hypothetical protein
MLQMQLVLQVLLQMQLVLLVHLMLQLVLQMLLQMQLVLLAPSPRVLVHLWLFPSPRVPHPLPFLQGFCTAPFFIAAFMPSKSCFFLFPPFPPHLWPPAPGG